MRYQIVGVILVGGFGCGAEPESVGTQAALSSRPIELVYTVGESECPTPGCLPPQGRAIGYVDLKNIAYRKDVWVHYGLRSSPHQWKTELATYVGPSTAGREIWRFETTPVTYPPRLAADFELVIGYEVAGRRYWDNNGRENYRVSTGSRTLGPQVLLGSSEVVLHKAGTHTIRGDTTLTGAVLVKDLAYHKVVRIVFTYDGWQTVREVGASYMRPSSNDSEFWHFERALGQIPAAAELELAVEYRVGGRSRWDNNFGRNYRIVAGRLERD